MDQIKQRIGFSILISLCLACQPKSPYPKEINQIDSTSSLLEATAKDLKAIDIELYQKEMQEVDGRYKFLTQNFKDSLDRHFWVVDMNAIIGVKKTYTRFLKNHKKMGEDIGYTLSQLDDLKNSLEDKKLSEEEIDQYLSQELKEARKIHLWGDYTFTALESSHRVWDSLQPRLDSITKAIATAE